LLLGPHVGHTGRRRSTKLAASSLATDRVGR
jgi:hypothetical protein